MSEVAAPPAGGLLAPSRVANVIAASLCGRGGELLGGGLWPTPQALAHRLERPLERLCLLHEFGQLADDPVRSVEHRPMAGALEFHVAAVLHDPMRVAAVLDRNPRGVGAPG